jgi:hypothetical protein
VFSNLRGTVSVSWIFIFPKEFKRRRDEMKRILLGTVLLSLVAFQSGSSADEPRKQNWTQVVRIGAWGLHPGNAERIVREAEDSHVFGIEVDNDIPGRYESFLDPA